jgi:phosphoribosylaminoimidazole-succinocarboxamide synthase
MGNVKKTDLLYEGKAKKVWAVEGNPDVVVQEFKNDATAFNGEKRGSWEQKGVVNNTVASALFKYLEASGIRTHFVEQLSPNEMLIKKLQIVPLEVIVRNRAAGSFVKRYAAKEGMIFKTPTFEFSYKRDDLGDPLINDSHAIAMELATESEIAHIRDQALKINALLKKFFGERGIDLIDFKLEFGKHKGEILLGDEISPDTCRFWDAKTGEKLDKDRFRFDLGNVEGAYQTMLNKVVGEKAAA